jgi:tetratricopeptide (TPR) repeat protein
LAFSNRGFARSNVGDTKGAIADYEKAISLDPQLGIAFNNRGSFYADQGDNERAMADYDRAISLDPNLDIAYMNRGIALYLARQYQKAPTSGVDFAGVDFAKTTRVFSKAIRINPDNAPAFLWRGKVKLAESISIKTKQRVQAPEPSEVSVWRQWVEGAIADFDKATRLDPTLQDADSGLKDAKRELAQGIPTTGLLLSDTQRKRLQKQTRIRKKNKKN